MTDEQKQNLEESKEAISKVIMLMRTIAIECHHAKTCFECAHSLNLGLSDPPRRVCGLDVGFPYEWDKATLRAFQKALNHAVDLTITKGDDTQ